MQNDREERFILRQRGAGKHPVVEADFGFDFPLAPQSSSRPAQGRQTPRTSLPAQRLNARTPVTAHGRSRSASADVTRQSIQLPNSGRQVSTSGSTRSISKDPENVEDPSMSKRRKFGSYHKRPASLESEELPNEQSGLFLNSTPVPAPRPSNRQSQISRHEASTSREVGNNEKPSRESREDTNAESTIKRPRGRPPKALPHAGRTGRPSLGTPTSQPLSNGSARKRGRPKGSKNSAQIAYVEEENLDISLPISQVVKGNRARTRRTLSSVVDAEHLDGEEQLSQEEEDEDDNEDEDEEENEDLKRPQRYKQARRPDEEAESTRNGSELEREDEDQDTRDVLDASNIMGASYNAIREKRQPKSSNNQNSGQAPKTKKGRPRKSDISMHDESQNAKQRSLNTVPIVVHRLRAPSPEEEEPGTAPLKGKIVRRGGVNAVDVLSQTCKEMMSKTTTLLRQEQEKETNNVKRGEWRRKRKIVEAFGDELDLRCYDLTEALDNNYALMTRVKQTNKKKLELRQNLLDVRKEREEIAMKMDKAKRQNDEVTKAVQEQVDLNAAMHDIELAIERGQATSRQDEDTNDIAGENLEILLRTITAEVSSASSEGGLLQSVKDFNDFLERAATVLEGRGQLQS